jgi:hypothetical protein
MLPSPLHTALLIPVDLLEPDNDYTLTASHLHGEGLLLHTDLPTTPHQLLRLRIHTADAPPPLILLAVVKDMLGPDIESGALGTTASVLLQLYALTPYTLTRWHRWLSWLDHQTQGQPTLPTPGDLDDNPDSAHLQLLHKLLARGRAHGRRAHPRYALAWQARLIVNGDHIETHTANLSVGGVLLLLPDDLPITAGFAYELILYHPDDGKHLHIPTVATRAPSPEEPNAVALRFNPDDDAQALTIRHFIESGIPDEERTDPLLIV